MEKSFRQKKNDYDTYYEKYTDKHNHDFSIKCLLEQREKDILARYDNYVIVYKYAYLCSKCYSFTVKKKPNDIQLYKITTKIDEEKNKVLDPEDEKLPRIIAYNSTQFSNPKYFDKIIFPDGYIYEKKGK